MEITDAFYFKDRKSWHRWLVRNHRRVDRVWLYHYNKNCVMPSVSHEEAVEEALCFGWIDSLLRRVDGEKYALMYSPRRPRSFWSKINKDKAEELIKLGRMQPAGFEKIEEARKNGLWDKAYTNRVIEAVPLDLEKALEKNPSARRNFRRFANTYRNIYIGWVNNARTDATRQKRIAEVVRRSTLNKKLLSE